MNKTKKVYREKLKKTTTKGRRIIDKITGLKGNQKKRKEDLKKKLTTKRRVLEKSVLN